jgi:hypothetical protein
MKFLFLAVVFSIASFHCGSESGQQPGASTPMSAPTKQIDVPSFSGTHAFEYLTAQTSFGPRNPNSPGHRNCLTYLQLELSKSTDVVSLQQFTQRGYNEVLNLTNIFARFNPDSLTRILLIAHWDTRPRAELDPDPKKRLLPIIGANDGASGVAVLLELAAIMKASPPPIGVDLLLVDGEDYGKEGDTQLYLLGARYFSTHLSPGYAPQFGILLDMVGDSELLLKKERYSLQYAPDVVDLVWSTAANIGVAQFSSELQNWVTDDHIPLNQAGIKTIDLIDFEYPDSSNRYWHTTMDTPDKCSPASLEAVGSVLAELIYRSH